MNQLLILILNEISLILKYQLENNSKLEKKKSTTQKLDLLISKFVELQNKYNVVDLNSAEMRKRQSSVVEGRRQSQFNAKISLVKNLSVVTNRSILKSEENNNLLKDTINSPLLEVNRQKEENKSLHEKIEEEMDNNVIKEAEEIIQESIQSKKLIENLLI